MGGSSGEVDGGLARQERSRLGVTRRYGTEHAAEEAVKVLATYSAPSYFVAR
jgi:hypothetical protein